MALKCEDINECFCSLEGYIEEITNSFVVQSVKEEFTMITECKFQPLWFLQRSSAHILT